MSESLHTFNRQLAAWVEPLARQGRYPFRKAELEATLLTEAGIEHPSLVLWINRDHFVAGGLLLLPEGDDDGCLPHACRCAASLGLAHFTLWGRRDISFWKIRNGIPECRRRETFAHEAGQTTSDFQNALLLILEDWKQNGIQFTVPPGDLSPEYFASLCWTTLRELLPKLAASIRQARADQPRGEQSALEAPEDAARRKGFLTLLRLMALDVFSLLPPTAPPEGLERAGRFALQTLPAPLASTLALIDTEPPLEASATIRFHHLLRRFGQLQFGHDRQRVARTIELLLDTAREWFASDAIPVFSDQQQQSLLLVHPDHPSPHPGALLEISGAVHQAAFNLIRALRELPFPEQQAVSAFSLRPPLTAQRVAGTLLPSLPPTRQECLQFNAQLRLSWPTRRYHIPAELPFWGWELLHLLGMAGAETPFTLRFPAVAATARYSGWLWTLLIQETTHIELDNTDENCWLLNTVKSPTDERDIKIIGRHGARVLRQYLARRYPAASMNLALNLPEELYSCLEDGRLQFSLDEHQDLALGIARYLRSSLAKTLWSWSGGTDVVPQQERPAHGLPIPAAEFLEELQAAWPEEGEGPSIKEIDQLLAERLPQPLLPQQFLPERPSVSRKFPAATKPITPDELAAEVFRDGIPLFPEHYLYDHYRPELIEFHFQSPLRIDGEFFDQFTLTDACGTSFTVAGRETAEALQLAAAGGRNQLSLPVEQQLTGSLLQRYRSDLQQRYREMRRLAFQQQGSRESAERLIARSWKRLPLPPPELFHP